jgi:hypothetical protein
MSTILEEYGTNDPPVIDESDTEDPATARLDVIVLPSGPVSISESAREIFASGAEPHPFLARWSARRTCPA